MMLAPKSVVLGHFPCYFSSFHFPSVSTLDFILSSLFSIKLITNDDDKEDVKDFVQEVFRPGNDSEWTLKKNEKSKTTRRITRNNSL